MGASNRLGLIASGAILFLACSSDEVPFGGASSSSGGSVCQAGQSLACACPNGDSGAQICKADGSGFGPCVCSGSGGGGASGGSSVGGGGAGGGGAGVCEPGATEPCYSGPVGTQDIGVCVAGLRTCNARGASFGPCEGEVVPSPELCATLGDDDCDGQTNEDGADCSCRPGTQADCYSGPLSTKDVGPCHAGTQLCNAMGTGYGPCVGEVGPLPETCTTPDDDDCDGQTNEGGAGCVCAPNATASCYDGPPGTENVGICKAGTKTCDDQGTAWSSCVGEILPGPDACATGADEDCNGAPTPCVDATPWSQGFAGPAGVCQVDRVATDAAGNVFALIGGAQACDLGDGPESGAIVLKLDPDGNLLWHDVFQVLGRDLAVDASGNVFIAGDYSGAPNLGGGPLPAPPSLQAPFVAKLDGAGLHVWSKGFPASSNGAYGYAVAVDPSGDVVLGGNFGGCIDFGSGMLCAPQSYDAFVAKFGATGTPLWSSIGDSAGGSVDGLATDAQGNIAVVGIFIQTIDWGGPPSNAAGPQFIAKLTSSGAPLFVKGCGGGVAAYPMHAAFDVTGNLVVTAHYNQGSVDFGGGPVGGTLGAVVAKLDPAGAHLWTKDNGASQYITAVAVDVSGNALVTGGFGAAVTMAGTALPFAGGVDIFLAKYDPNGVGLGATAYGDALEQAGWTLAVDPIGAKVLGGWNKGQVDFGTGAMVASGTTDGFIAKLAQ